VRRVQQAIEDHFGISFVKFVRAARLHQAHAALLRNAERVTVTEIATRYGFWHLGRFSSYYCEMFGQPPSRTPRHGAVRSAAPSPA
jgi:AraC-like DNA-binding protein